MAATVVFPKSSSPGQRPGEGAGALINCYADLDGAEVVYPRSAGLTVLGDTGVGTPRGFLATSGVLYAAVENALVSMTSGGVATALTGAFSGVTPVTMARNNNNPTPDIAMVADSVPYY